MAQDTLALYIFKGVLSMQRHKRATRALSYVPLVKTHRRQRADSYQSHT